MSANALAWDGQGTPNDPNYAPAESNPVTSCINDEEWPWFSFIPKCTPAARDPEGAAGMSIDKVWKQFTTGRPDVRIAYIEGGPNWHSATARRELATRMYLNTGELPLPEHAGRLHLRRLRLQRRRPGERDRLPGRPARRTART